MTLYIWSEPQPHHALQLDIGPSHCRKEWQFQQPLRSGALQSVAYVGKCRWLETRWVPSAWGSSSSSSNVILSIDLDGWAWVFNAGAKDAQAHRLFTSPSLQLVASMGRDELLHLLHEPRHNNKRRRLQKCTFDPASGVALSTMFIAYSWMEESVELSSLYHHGMHRIAGCSDDGRLVVMDAETTEKLFAITLQAPSSVPDCSSCLRDLAWSANGSMLAIFSQHMAPGQIPKTSVAVYEGLSGVCLQSVWLADAPRDPKLEWSSSKSLLASKCIHSLPLQSELWAQDASAEGEVGHGLDIRVLNPAQRTVSMPPLPPPGTNIRMWEQMLEAQPCWTPCGNFLIVPCAYGWSLLPQYGVGIVDPDKMSVVYSFEDYSCKLSWAILPTKAASRLGPEDILIVAYDSAHNSLVKLSFLGGDWQVLEAAPCSPFDSCEAADLSPCGTALIGKCNGYRGNRSLHHLEIKAELTHAVGQSLVTDERQSIRWAPIPTSWQQIYALPYFRRTASDQSQRDCASLAVVDVGTCRLCGSWPLAELDAQTRGHHPPSPHPYMSCRHSKPSWVKVSGMMWSPDGSHLAVYSLNNSLQILTFS